MKNNYLLVIIALTLLGCADRKTDEKNNESAPAPLYRQMADSEMIRTPDPRLLDFRDKPKWEYTNGLVCLSFLKVYEKTHDEKYLNYVKFYADSMIQESGKIDTYKMSDFNIDRVNPGRFLIMLNKIDPKPKYQKAIDSLRKQMKGHPRTSEGGFWHKKRYTHQMWLDGLYMGSPFLTLYARTYGEDSLYDDVANQFYLIDKYTYVPETGLYKHGWDESREQRWADKETGQSPNYWGRAIGWLAMAVVDVLEYFPEDHPRREVLLKIADKIAQGIIKYQDNETGLWWQVLDRPGDDGNYLEASCSSMFTYFLLKGVKHGYIANSYLENATRAYEGIQQEFIESNDDGTISLTQVCAVAGLGGDPYRDASYEYYVNEKIRDNDPKGVGPFIMASLLYNELNP